MKRNLTQNQVKTISAELISRILSDHRIGLNANSGENQEVINFIENSHNKKRLIDCLTNWIDDIFVNKRLPYTEEYLTKIMTNLDITTWAKTAYTFLKNETAHV